jgi:hypothetical protein
MIKDLLDKLIRKIILAKFPFIQDYEISVTTFRPSLGGSKKIGYERYRVNYFLSPDEDGTFAVTDDLQEIEDLTKLLFDMLGPKNYQNLEGVEFYADED